MLVGVPGNVLGITAEAFAVVPDPAALTARTRRNTDVPFVRPVNVWLRTPEPTNIQFTPSRLT